MSKIVMALAESGESLSTTQISELISRRSKGRIYRISATLKDSLEFRLKREGYVKGIVEANKTLYSITPNGRKLLKGWIAFLSAYS
jgi:DNA-binding PadR family transcriptional regulator